MAPFLLFALLTPSLRDTIDKLTAAKGSYSETEDVHRVELPRGSWAAFQGIQYTDTGGLSITLATGVMVVAQLNLFQDEINPVISAAIDSGLEVAAIDAKSIHLFGSGDTERMASAIRKTMAQMKLTRPYPSRASSLAAEPIDSILGRKGETKAGIYRLVLPRKTKLNGRPISGQMGLSSWAVFTGAPEAAYIDGTFALRPIEMPSVIRALLSHGMTISTIHNHMTDDEPRFVFVHFSGKGKSQYLATGLKSALDELARYTFE